MTVSGSRESKGSSDDSSGRCGGCRGGSITAEAQSVFVFRVAARASFVEFCCKIALGDVAQAAIGSIHQTHVMRAPGLRDVA